MAGLLGSIVTSGGRVPVGEVKEGASEQVAKACGYELRDAEERKHVARLVECVVCQMVDIGALARDGAHDEVVLTSLGGP